MVTHLYYFKGNLVSFAVPLLDSSVNEKALFLQWADISLPKISQLGLSHMNFTNGQKYFYILGFHGDQTHGFGSILKPRD